MKLRPSGLQYNRISCTLCQPWPIVASPGLSPAPPWYSAGVCPWNVQQVPPTSASARCFDALTLPFDGWQAAELPSDTSRATQHNVPADHLLPFRLHSQGQACLLSLPPPAPTSLASSPPSSHLVPVGHCEGPQIGDDTGADQHVTRQVVVLDAQLRGSFRPARLLATQALQVKVGWLRASCA